MSKPSIVNALIDAQTAYVIAELGSIDRDSVADVVSRFLKVAETVTLSDCVPLHLAVDVAHQVRSHVPASVGGGEAVEAVLDVAFAGPTHPVTPSELVARDQLEDVLDELLGHTHLLENVLEEITSGPLVGAVASRFIGRLMSEVMAANQAVADKVPGLGALVSFGTSAAAKVASVADKQLEAVLGDTAGKSAAFAVRKLNTIVLDIARDPATREAILEVWDQVSERPVSGLEGAIDRDDASRLTDAVRAMVATAADTDAAADLARRLVESIYARYGALPVADLITDFDVDRELLVDHLHTLATAVAGAVVGSDLAGDLIRERIAGFFTSADVLELLNR